jgi:hypothetical protein
MYGATDFGGAYTEGVLWEITSKGVYMDLHDFGGKITRADGSFGTDGTGPNGVTFDSAGNLWGTAGQGGANSKGILWEYSKGTYKDIHDFGSTAAFADGSNPNAPVTFDAAGNMYGTTQAGGANDSVNLGSAKDGTVWKMTKGGSYTVLHNFGGASIHNASGGTSVDGAFPAGPVTVDSSGNLYGTCQYGGPNGENGAIYEGDGLVWEITSKGVYTDLHDFGGSTSFGGQVVNDGKESASAITFDTSGNMYGAAYSAGPNGDGIIWTIKKSGPYSIVHAFGGQTELTTGTLGADGALPILGVSFDAAGNMYGVTYAGGAYSGGILWEITSAGLYQDLHDFAGKVSVGGQDTTDGTRPTCSLTFDSSGVIYGTTLLGGANSNGGTVWSFKPPVALKSLTVAPSPVLGSTSSAGVVTLNTSAPTGGTIVDLTSSTTAATVPSFVTVPAGKTTFTFTVKTAPVGVNTDALLTAKIGSSSKTATIVVDAPTVKSFTLSPTSVVGGSSTPVTGTVALTGLPPSAGLNVKLTSSDPSLVTVPATLFFHSGHLTATFNVTHKETKVQVGVSIAATFNGTTIFSKLQVTP